MKLIIDPDTRPDLVPRLAAFLDGEHAREVIFALAWTLGAVIIDSVPRDRHEEAIQACVHAMQMGMEASGAYSATTPSETEH